MTEQNAGNPPGGPGISAPGPAAGYIKELQTLSGAHATGNAPPGTPTQAGGQASAPGQSGGGSSPASPPAPSGEQAQWTQLVGVLDKMSQRMDAQGQFLTRLDGKLSQQRQEFENRFVAPRGSSGDDGGNAEDPPQVDMNAMAKTITQAVVNQVRSDFAPLVKQTAANSVSNRVAQAQLNPATQEMVNALPPDVRANLAGRVYEIAGEKIFAEPNPMFDTPDPVHEAIELVHYRTVVKTGYKAPTSPQAPQANQADAVQQQPTPQQGFSPVPTQGAHSQAPVVNEQEQFAEKMFNIKLGKDRTRYPAGIEQELGMS